VLLPLKSFSRQIEPWITAQDCFKDNLSLQPDKGCTNAKVDANAKAKMTSLAASNIEFIWIGETLRVAIGGPETQVQYRTLRQADAVEVDVLGDPPREHRIGWLPADRLLDGVAERGEMDVIADLALPVPATVICEMMGVPVADRAKFTEWTAQATHLLAAMLVGPEVVERGLAASMSLAGYFQDLIDDRRTHLTDDILSNLIRAEEAGDRLSTAELLSQLIGLLIAGFETTIGLIGNGVLQLIRHPDQLAKLQANPSLVASAVEECLRFDGPIALTGRYLHADAEFALLFPGNRPAASGVSEPNWSTTPP